ncbi:nucleotidyl transferase AbiEii/AbiGii toxin family protein [Phenylobacterium sp.]|uniref:nucleotidyl transferase AbiEii/AbiGii toxin family protein n=1 Tax=Phenylobacterium sp. TaxID=1871053 RepID=UPI0030F44E66
MTNTAYDDILRANADTRLGLFTATAQRLGTTPQNVEKDFWVCWTLGALFNGLPEGGPRLLFKGGTSLSKGFGLISRFSEDIDVTVFRDDLGQGASIEDLAAMSRTQRLAKLEAIRAACQTFIQGDLRTQLQGLAAAAAERAGLTADQIQIVAAEDDGQTLLVVYPAATPADSYVRHVVRIESGAKSALDPNTVRTLAPYVDQEAVGLDLKVGNVTVVNPERTFWDKVVIVHGLRRWFERRGKLKGGGERSSRHYYDLHRLVASEVGAHALADLALGADCVAHARMFFDRPDYDLATAAAPTFALTPHDAMLDALRRDYGAMSAMIFGQAPTFDAVMSSVAALEAQLNR